MTMTIDLRTHASGQLDQFLTAEEMRYIHVTWFHDHLDEPMELYSELDDEAREVRKVEVFGDGNLGFADALESSNSTRLGLEPVPPLKEIALDAQFRPEEIAKDEFERLWDLARSGADSRQELNY
jgi:hypothetical protein